ncbi:MAG: 3'-5' exonuclease [Moraxellaceae bacterium]|nr:3'-5' exonuclease [Moraxellaceae bacterium]MDZ4387382.1 3'-5' exonuclease [Moraxellaceae bacterium]
MMWFAKHAPVIDVPLADLGAIVLDLETTGLKSQHDHILAIAAYQIRGRQVDVAAGFEAALYVSTHKPSEATLVHGITATDVSFGEEPRQALMRFKSFIKEQPIFAFHAPFDQAFLQRAYKQALRQKLTNVFVDVAELAAMLSPDLNKRPSLDDCISHFGLSIASRHQAYADAWVTAELVLILLVKAQQQGINTLLQLLARLQQWRALQAMHGN